MFRGNKKSLLDHITTNSPTHVSNINTEPMGTSDHHMVTFDLKMKEYTENPKFHYSQYWKRANKNDIELGISLNPDLREMLMENNGEHAWRKLLKASNNLCNYYAPSIIIQRKSNFQPCITDEIRDIEKNIKNA